MDGQNRHLTRRSLLAAAGAGATAAAVGSTAHATPDAVSDSASGLVDVQLLNITDLHGYLQPTTGGDSIITGAGGVKLTVGGTAYLATHLAKLRAGRRNSIFFSSGDNFSGWPFEVDSQANEPTIEVLNKLGLDFSTVGNHELDQHFPDFLIGHMEHGRPYPVVGRDDSFPDSTGRRFHGADFPFYTANIVHDRDGKPILPPYNVVWVDAGHGRKLPVGFIHMTVADTPTGSTSYQPELRSLDPVATANRYAAELKRRGVRAIVINIHDGGVAGTDYNSGSNPSGPMFDLAARVDPDIAAIVTGHWHCRFNMMVPGPDGMLRPIVEAGLYGQLISEITLKLDPRTGAVVRELTTSTNHPVTRDVPPDQEIQDIADYWWARGAKRYATPLATTTGDFTRTLNASGESTMGNLAADAALWSANTSRDGRADLAMISVKPATGSVALSGDLLYAKGSNAADADGTILFGEAWGAFGYGNTVLTVTVTGAQLHAALEQQWQQQANVTEKFAPFAVCGNVSYGYDLSQPVGQRVDPAGVLIDGKPLDTARSYRLAALAYTLIGADGYSAFTGFTEPFRNDRDHEGFIKYLRAHPTISPAPLGRAHPAG